MIELLNTLDLQFLGGEVLHDEELNQIVSHINNVVGHINSTIIPAIENIPKGSDGKDGKAGKDGLDGAEGISSLNAFVGATNTEEALLKLGDRNLQAYPPGLYSIGSNVLINNGEVLFMTSARRKGINNWLYGEDGYIWGVPVLLGTGNTTSTTGVDTDNLNYIYCRTLRNVDAASLYTSVASTQFLILDYIENHPGSGVKVNNNQLTYIADLDNNTNSNINGAWTDHPYGIDETFPHEWMVGYKKNEQDLWEYYFGPIMISNYGYNGLDGDGYEYIFARNDSSTIPPEISYGAYNGKNPSDDDFVPRGWSDEPLGVLNTVGCHYEWVTSRKKYGNPAVWHEFKEPKLWGRYSSSGSNGLYRLWAYKNAVSIDAIPESTSTYPPNGWTTYATTPDFANGEYTWCIERTVTFDSNNTPIYGPWSSAHRITGDNGNPGEDGSSVEFIYRRFKTEQTFGNNNLNPEYWESNQNPDYTGEAYSSLDSDALGNKWQDNPKGVNGVYMYEYVSSREYKYQTLGATQKTWGKFCPPAIWSKWGEKGEDGDGVEYIYYAGTSETTLTGDSYPPNWTQDANFQNPGYIKIGSGWEDNPIDLNQSGLGQGSIEWVSIRKKINNIWELYSPPVIWTRLAKDGVVEGYIVDFTNENMPVATSSNGDVPSYTNLGTIQVYYNGTPLSYDANGGSGHFSYSIGTIIRSDGNTVNSNAEATSEKIIATPNGANISISMTNVSLFNTKNAYIPVTVTLPNNSTNTFNITLFGISSGLDGEPGEAIDLFLSSKVIRTNYNLTTVTPYSITVGVKIGKNIYYSHDVNNSAESLGYTFKYYYDNSSSNPSDVPNTGVINLAANGGAGIALLDLTVLMYYTPSGGSPTLIDYETIPYIKDGERGSAEYIYLKGTARDVDSNIITSTDCVVNVNGGANLVTTEARGLNLVTINRLTLAKIESINYDTYGEAMEESGATGITDLINKLNTLDNSVFVCLVSYDAIGWNSSLINALQSFGLGDIPYPETGRRPFLFIGYKGIGLGNGLMRMRDVGAYTDIVELSIYIANGTFTTKDGTNGQSSFKSIVFKRTNTTPVSAPTGGSYFSPVPSGWYDGIPSGEEMLWSSTRIFTSDGLAPQLSVWTTPCLMTDTETYDVEFAKIQANDATPAAPVDGTNGNRHGCFPSSNQIWFDPVNDSSENFTLMYWRAEREIKNGVPGTWTIIRIKGELGDPGGKATSMISWFLALSGSTQPSVPTVTIVNGVPLSVIEGQTKIWHTGLASDPAWNETYKYLYEVDHYTLSDNSDYWSSPYFSSTWSEQGPKGDDAVSVVISPSSILIEQDINNKNNIAHSATNNLGRFSIQILKGSTACTITSVTATGSHVNISNSVSQGYYIDPDPCTWQPGTQITNLYIKGIAKDGQNNYYSTGLITLSIEYTDPDTNTNKTITNIIVKVYVNLIGSWSESIKGDIKTELASRTLYKIDNDPNSPTYGQFVESINWGEFQRSSTLNISRITQRINNGKNLFGGSLTGSGWNLNGNIIETDNENKFLITSGYLESPDVTIDSNYSHYVVSYEASSNAVIKVYDNGTDMNVTGTTGTTLDGRRYFKFSTLNLGGEYLIRFSGVSYIIRPQLEAGEEATAFETSSTETSSKIKLTANEINQSVTNLATNTTTALNLKANSADLTTMQSGLETAGIHLDGQNSVINLKAGKVNFVDPNGDPYQTPKVSIDPTNGTLHVVDGVFEGDFKSGAYTESSVTKYANEIGADGSGHLAKGKISWNNNGVATIGGFTIGQNELTNSDWQAGIDIAYDNKVVKIGENAKGAMNQEDAILRAENAKSKSLSTDTYNTALYLNAQGAKYNYAFYGNGSGVLNGLVFGYKVQLVEIPTGSQIAHVSLKLNGGSTFIITGNHTSRTVFIDMPTLSEVKTCLGINDNSTRFAIEITILNQSPYNANVLGFRNTEDSGLTGALYPYLVNNDGNEDQGAYQTSRGDVFKILLTNYIYMNDGYSYGAQFISRIQ